MRPNAKSRAVTLVVSVAALATVLSARPALAKDGAPAADQAATGDTTSGSPTSEIIVTARKVAERLQDVPVAVSAFSGAVLQARNATKVSDIAAFTPGLITMQGDNNPTVLLFSIRGQVQRDSLATLEPSVGTYIDGLYVARSYGINGDLVDVSNVQVLKGPQGTLFGRNTSAGAVLVETNNPKLNALEAEIHGTYGRFNQQGLGGVFNLPIVTDTFAIRGAIDANHRDGYITDVISGAKYDSYDTLTGRVKALWKPAPNIAVLASADWYSYKSDGPARFMAYGGPNYNINNSGAAIAAGAPNCALAANAFSCAPVPTYATLVDYGALAGPPFNIPPAALAALGIHSFPQTFGYYTNLEQTDPNAVAADVPPYTDTRTQTYTLTATDDQAYGTWKVVGGYRKITSLANVDLDGTPYQILASEAVEALHQWSIEGQLTGRILANRLNYAVGATYFTEAGTDLSYSATLVPLQGYGYYQGDIDNKSVGIYGQGSYHITDKLTFTAGLRWSQDKKGILTHNEDVSGYGPTAAVLACDLPAGVATFTAGASLSANCPAAHADTFHNLSYTIGLDYKITRDVLVYAKASKGYRAGGENLRANGDAATFAPFLPEENYEEEIGIKSEFFDHTVRLNIAAYYNDIHNAQRSQLLAVTSGPATGQLLTVLGNADLARDYGFEADLAIRVSPDVTLQATGDITNSKYLNYTAPVVFGSSVLTDHRAELFEIDPKGSFTVAANYRRDFGGVRVTGRIDYSWTASYYDSPDSYGSYPLLGAPASTGTPLPAAEIAAFTTPATGILGARLGLGFHDDKYTVAVWGKNLTNNRDTVSSFNVSPFGLVSGVHRDPVSYGVTLSARY